MVKYPHTQQELDEQIWQETTEERYYDMLGAVPPFEIGNGAFVLGEEWCHSDDGRTIGLMYVSLRHAHRRRYFFKPDVVKDFDAEKYRCQILKQLNHQA